MKELLGEASTSAMLLLGDLSATSALLSILDAFSVFVISFRALIGHCHFFAIHLRCQLAAAIS